MSLTVPIGTALLRKIHSRVVCMLRPVERSHRVGAPAGRPCHLVDLLLDGGGDRTLADVGIDLDEEAAADRHRLDLGVVRVDPDDGTAAGDLVADKLRRQTFAQREAPAGRLGPDVLPRRATVRRDGEPPEPLPAVLWAQPW